MWDSINISSEEEARKKRRPQEYQQKTFWQETWQEVEFATHNSLECYEKNIPGKRTICKAWGTTRTEGKVQKQSQDELGKTTYAVLICIPQLKNRRMIYQESDYQRAPLPYINNTTSYN